MFKASLFSGIGGIDLAAHWAGMETVVFCEREPFPQRVLRKNFPGVPIIDDVHNFTREELEKRDIIGDRRAIRLISAGYPCQPESLVGQRKGSEDDRWLWPEVARTLDELSPAWFLGENVTGHITMGLDKVLDDLDHLEYTARPFHIPALGVDADHERYRIFIVAYSNREPGSQAIEAISAVREKWDAWENAGRSSWRPIPRTGWNISGPPVSRDIDGIPDRVDRCTAIGNAVNPYHVFPILKGIKCIDEWVRRG